MIEDCSYIKKCEVLVQCMTYNHSKYITDALNGFAMQKTDFPFVCMVMDDASTDGEQEVIKDFLNRECLMDKAEYYDHELADIVIVGHKTNQNCTFAVYFLKVNLYNTNKKEPLINEWCSKSEYIALCEGDDYWIDPLKLQKQIDFLKSHRDVSMVFHSAKVVKVDRTIEAPKFGNVEDRIYTEKDFVAAWTIPTASMVFRNTVLSYKIKEPEKILNGDIFLVEQCAHTGKVFGISDEMSVYRVHDGGVTYDKRLKFSRMMSLSDHYECLALNFPDIDRHLYNKQWSEAYLFRARHESNYTKRKKYLILAFKTGGISLPFWMLQNLVFRFFSSLGIAKMNKLVLRKHKS